MIKYVVADASGAILRSGVCAEADVTLQGAGPQRVYTADPALYPTDHVDDTAWRIDAATGRLTSTTGADGGALSLATPP